MSDMDYKFPPSAPSWLADRTVFLTIFGSNAYGTNLPGSDLDIRGVCVPPAKYYLGYLERFEQAVCKDGQDTVVYEIKKFFKLCADANPNALEIIFTDPRHHLLVTPIGEELMASRDMFLSKKAQYTFSGYAVSQLGRIKRHRRWLLNPPSHQPTRAEFGMPERTVIPADQMAVVWAQVKAKLEEWDVDYGTVLDDAARIDMQSRISKSLAQQFITADNQWMAAARTLGVNENFIDLMDKEKRYHTAQTEWRQYETWKNERNPARAELEAKHGYDTKHAMHLVRLLRTGKEVLEGKGLQVFRPDREELLAIRAGEMSYDSLVEYAARIEKEMIDAMANSPLPWGPDYKKLDTLCQTLVEKSLQENK